MKTKKEQIIAIIETMEEDEINFMNGLFGMNNYFTTQKLLNLFAPELDQNKIDTAYPCDYAKRIREIYPDFDNGYMIYDYNSAMFGEMVNINNIIAKRLFSFFEDAIKNYIKKTV